MPTTDLVVPANPNVVLSRSEIEARFGRFGYRVNPDRTLTILGAWVEENISVVYIPELDGVPTYGGTFGGRVRWHKKGVEQLQRAWHEVGASGLAKYVKFWDGGFFPRLITGGTRPSNHAWGTAFDINATWNGYNQKPAPPGATGDLNPLVPIFQKHGFAWGGGWKTPDPMHFELARVVVYSVAQDAAAPAPLLVINGNANQTLVCIMRDNRVFASRADVARVAGLPLPKDPNEAARQMPVADYLRANGFLVTWHGEQGDDGKFYAYKTS